MTNKFFYSNPLSRSPYGVECYGTNKMRGFFAALRMTILMGQ